MSSDLVKRLRERPGRLAAESNDQMVMRRQAERDAAAAHIEALEGEVTRWRNNSDIADVQIADLKARAERLRVAAVEQVKQYPDYSAIMRKALEDKQ
jgi:hypothetical protein